MTSRDIINFYARYGETIKPPQASRLMIKARSKAVRVILRIIQEEQENQKFSGAAPPQGYAGVEEKFSGMATAMRRHSEARGVKDQWEFRTGLICVVLDEVLYTSDGKLEEAVFIGGAVYKLLPSGKIEKI